MSRLGNILTRSFTQETGSCPMSAIRVLNQHHEWSEPIVGVDKIFFINLALTNPAAESTNDLLEKSVLINDGKIEAHKVGSYKAEDWGLVIPHFVDVASGKTVDYDAIDTLTMEDLTLSSQLQDLFHDKSDSLQKAMVALLNLIERYAQLPEEGGAEDYRVIVKFCEI